jgi:hypothetical protein
MNGNRPELWFFVYNKGVNAALKGQGDCFWPYSLYLIGMYRLFVPVKKTKQKDGGKSWHTDKLKAKNGK